MVYSCTASMDEQVVIKDKEAFLESIDEPMKCIEDRKDGLLENLENHCREGKTMNSKNPDAMVQIHAPDITLALNPIVKLEKINLAIFVEKYSQKLTGHANQDRRPLRETNGIIQKPASYKGEQITVNWCPKVVLEPLKQFICKICTKQFDKSMDYHLHRLQHVNEKVMKQLKPAAEREVYEKRFSCPSCPARFVLASTLHAHAAVHAPRHACRCGAAYLARADLRAHQRLLQHYPPKQEFKPDIAGLFVEASYSDEEDTNTFGKKNKLKHGLKTKSDTAKNAVIFKCQCGKTCGSLDALWLHKVSHSPRVFECALCAKVVKSKASLKMHLLAHADTRPHACPRCPRRFTQHGALKIHLLRHDGVKSHKCPHCDKQFCSKGNLQIHVRIHTGEKPYSCSFCEKKFSDKSGHARHERTHTGYCPYECECGKRFTDAGAFRNHKDTHGSRRYPCPHCSKTFRVLSYMRVHQQNVHNSQKKYECDHCGKRTNQKNNLQRHIFDVHLQTFFCNICLKKFCSETDLREHKSTPCELKQYVCEICDRVFSKFHAYKEHIIYLHGRNKLSCDLCGFSGTTKNSVRAHLLKQHSHLYKKCKKRRKPV